MSYYQSVSDIRSELYGIKVQLSQLTAPAEIPLWFVEEYQAGNPRPKAETVPIPESWTKDMQEMYEIYLDNPGGYWHRGGPYATQFSEHRAQQHALNQQHTLALSRWETNREVAWKKRYGALLRIT